MVRNFLGFITLIAVFTGYSANTFAADVRVVATIDKNEGSLEDYFELAVAVEGRATGKPEIPQMAGLEFRFEGTSQQVQILNGQMSQKTDYRYIVRAQRLGTYVIPSITVTARGTVEPSDPITLQITQAPQRPVAEQNIFLAAEVSKDHAYVGEQILYSLKFYRRINTASAELKKPGWEGFSVETLGQQRDFERALGQRHFQVSELNFALFPTQPGISDITPAQINYEGIESDSGDPFARFGFFNSGRRIRGTVTSPGFKIKVLPLPQTGKSQNFTGLVGNFSLKADLSKSAVVQGDSLTLTVTLEGSGNVRQRVDLDLNRFLGAEFQRAFKVYDDKPQMNVRVTSKGLEGKQIFKKALVPQRDGPLVIPPLQLTYFDPKKGQYANLNSEGFKINVSPAKEGQKFVVSGAPSGVRKENVEVLAEDLMPLCTKTGVLKDESFSKSEVLFFAAFASSPPLAFIGAWILQSKKRRYLQNEAQIRSSRALKNAQAALKRINHQPVIQKGQNRVAAPSPEYFSELGKILRIYIGEKLHLKGVALTPKEAAEACLRNRARAETAQTLEDLLSVCESAQYARGMTIDNKKAHGAGRDAESIAHLLKRLDRELKGEVHRAST